MGKPEVNERGSRRTDEMGMGRMLGRLLVVALLLVAPCGCVLSPQTADTSAQSVAQAASSDGRGEEAKTGADPEMARRFTQSRPTVTMPPEPGERTDKETWDEADQRSTLMRETIEEEIAAVVPGPYPPPKEAKPAPAKAPTAPAKAPPAPAPAPAPARPAAVEPKAAQAPAPAPAPVATSLPGEPVTVPELRLTEKFTTAEGLPNDLVSALYVDETDAWVGTSGGGMARYNFAEKNWIVTREVDGLASDFVSDIEKFKGRIFVGTKSGLSIWDGFSWTTMKEFDKVQFLNVVLAVKGGELWLAARNMRGGIAVFDGEKWVNKTTMRSGMLLNNVSDLAFDGEDLWLGTTNRGVSVLREKKWTDYSVTDGIASNFVYNLVVLKGRCFLGGCCGLSHFDGAKWIIYDVPEGLAHSTVNALILDGGLLWLGTKNGLSVFDGEAFTNFYVEDGLLADNRVTALFSRGDDLWVGTAGGLSRLKKSY